MAELSALATDIDAEIAREAIRAIGRVAVGVAEAVDGALAALLSLMELDITHVLEETVVALRDVLRKYPQTAEVRRGRCCSLAACLFVCLFVCLLLVCLFVVCLFVVCCRLLSLVVFMGARGCVCVIVFDCAVLLPSKTNGKHLCDTLERDTL